MTRRKLQHEITNSERKPLRFQQRALSKNETCKNTVGGVTLLLSTFSVHIFGDQKKKRLLRQIIMYCRLKRQVVCCTELQDKQVHDQQPLCAGTLALSVNNYHSSRVIRRFAQLCSKTLCLYLLINLYNSIFLEENISRGLMYHWLIVLDILLCKHFKLLLISNHLKLSWSTVLQDKDLSLYFGCLFSHFQSRLCTWPHQHIVSDHITFCIYYKLYQKKCEQTEFVTGSWKQRI